MIGRRRDRFLVRVPPERALEVGADPSRFHEFNPLVRVPERGGRVERVGNVYHQLLGVGPLRVSTRWETVSVDPPNLADHPRPPVPWTTVEAGQIPVFGAWTSTTRLESVTAGTLITHDLEYGLPDGLFGRFLDLVLMKPLLTVAFGFVGRRAQRWIEAADG